jgi:hypothetical protein
VAGVVVIAAVAGVVVSLAGHGSGRPSPAHVAARPAPTTTTTPPAPPTTTATSVPVQLVATAPDQATYRVRSGAHITLSATGRCWVEIRRGTAAGAVVFSGTLVAGQTQGVAGSAWVRLGNPAVVTVTVDGTSLSPPGLSGSPYDLEFS